MVTKHLSARHVDQGKTRFGAPLLLAVGSLLVGMVISYVVGAFLPTTSATDSPHVAWWLSALTVIAFFISYGGLTAALAWWTRRFGVGAPSTCDAP